MAERKQRPGRRGFGALVLSALLLIAAIFLTVLAATRLWPESTIDPKKPSSWPVNETRAVVLAKGDARVCPENAWIRNIAGTPWRYAGTWQKSDEGGAPQTEGGEPTLSGVGILCLRADRDFGELHKIGLGAEDAPGSALYLAVVRKEEGGCPPGANYETDQYCLIEASLPPAPDITP